MIGLEPGTRPAGLIALRHEIASRTGRRFSCAGHAATSHGTRGPSRLAPRASRPGEGRRPPLEVGGQGWKSRWNGGRPPPFRRRRAPRVRSMSPSTRSRCMYRVCVPRGAIGKTPHPPRDRPVRAGRGVRPVYSPSFPGRRRGGSDRGGPAIARSRRVARPVRRPMHRQTQRRRHGDHPREICNQVPRHAARGLLIPGAR